MKELLYKKENNLFQSLNWAAFQENYGRKIVHFKDFLGVEAELSFGKSFVWVQKAPLRISNFEFRISNLSNKVIFVRIEPKSITDKDIKKYNLKKVTHNSLLAGQKSPKKTSVLDISKTEEEILANMKSKTRYNIKLATKKGVTVKMMDDEDILYDLLEKTAKRQKEYNPHPKSYYTKMIKDLSCNDVAKIFVAYTENSEPVAAILISFFGEVATYLHGGFSDKHRNLMAPYLCHMEAIKYAKEKSCKYYDFWGIAETESEDDPWLGITRFKRSFGGEDVEFDGAYDLVISNFWYNLLTVMARVRRIFK